MPILSKQIIETLVPIIQTEVKKCVMDEMEPLLHKIDSQNKTIEKQQQQITMQFIQLSALQSTTKDQVTSNKERDNDVNFLYNRVAELEDRLEIQEQYSRRTSLRFNNIPIPVDQLSGEGMGGCMCKRAWKAACVREHGRLHVLESMGGCMCKRAWEAACVREAWEAHCKRSWKAACVREHGRLHV
ncbi:unnamed protein product [Mytilus coruscus]|uniref:Uncharacterized protein n=1 Tax=Mytilus coruscus TaxID=42192 RepID=A0A6J8EBR5_MYTCO|nr:unnamed protein product [Mytilus coruscus]